VPHRLPGLRHKNGYIVHIHFLGAPAALSGVPSASRIHENASHHLRGYGEKLSPMLPIHLLDVHQAKVHLADESRGLERIAGPLVAHVLARHATQLLVNHGHQPV
jgi:hypothetical protein